MTRAELLAPRTWGEAHRLRRDHPGAVVVAGGTALLGAVAGVSPSPPQVLSLHRLPPGGIEADAARVRVDAGVTLAELFRSEAVSPLLGGYNARWLANPGVRLRGTVAGNVLATGWPRDLALPFLAARARAETVGGLVPLERVLAGQVHDLLRAIVLDRPRGCAVARYARRTSSAPTIVGIALARHPDGDHCVLQVDGRPPRRVPGAEAAWALGADALIDALAEAALESGASDPGAVPVVARRALATLSRAATGEEGNR
jgi:CO/xanthine dehydrogenase FAD-binding subunit